MTDGNSEDFGDLSEGKNEGRCCNDPVRVIYSGGYVPSLSTKETSKIETFIMASKGNATDWGDMRILRESHAALANSTRGLISNGSDDTNVRVKTIESITIASGGNTIDFGGIYAGAYNASGASQTRGLVAGGTIPGTTYLNNIEYMTISTAGDAMDFGDLSRPCYGVTGLSDSHGGLGGY